MDSIQEKMILQDLGDGLVLRHATAGDLERLAEFNASVQGIPDQGEPDRRVGAWTRDLLSGVHPTVQRSDFTVVEDTQKSIIVSSLVLIPQTWIYAGIPFNVGRVELVGTLPEYRQRGLIRAQFELVHRWCEERGLQVQSVSGIPYYYRQFGYEMCLELAGGRAGFFPQIPALKAGQNEPYHIRRAEEEDIPFIAELYDHAYQRYLVSSKWDPTLWRYEIRGKSIENVCRVDLRVIITPQGERVGFLAHPPYRWGALLGAVMYEIRPGLSWATVTPSVIRYLQATGPGLPTDHHSKEFQSFGFWLGSYHPAYEVMIDTLPRVRNPYAWYLRVPDLAGFIRHVAPVLEQRLQQSALVGYSGEILLTFYRKGLRMLFEQGKLVEVTSWKPQPLGNSGNAGFPDLTFLRLLFGHNTIDELRVVFADCWVDGDESYALLNALFPKRPSSVFAIS